jgi:hypothetical protein
MDETIAFGKNNVTLEEIRGTLQGYHKRSETHVSGYGGGPQDQHVNISSTVSTISEFFIVDKNGKEHDVCLRNAQDLILREGQEVSLIKCGGCYIALVNHNTDKIHLLESRDNMYQNSTTWHYVLPPILAIWLHYYFDLGWLGSILGAFGLTALIVIFVTSKILTPRATARFDKELLPILKRIP